MWPEEIQRIVGDFNSGEFHSIREFHATSTDAEDDDDYSTEVRMIVAYGDRWLLDMQLCRASGFTISGGRTMALGELFIDDVSERGWEALRYHLFDEVGSFKAYCEDIRFLTLWEQEGTETQQVWPVSE